MNRNDLFNALNELDDSCLEQSETGDNNTRKKIRMKWVLAAACFLITAAGIFLAVKFGFYRNMQGKEPQNENIENTYSGSVGEKKYAENDHYTTDDFGGKDGGPKPTMLPGGNGSSVDNLMGGEYLTYEGPIMPLSILENGTDIKADRKIEFSFSPSKEKISNFLSRKKGQSVSVNHYELRDKSLVTDIYKLKNDSEEDKELTIIYPFVGCLSMDQNSVPVITINEETITPEIHIGPYAGEYDSGGIINENYKYNLTGINTWEGYKKAMEGDYLTSAFDELPKADEKILVYELKDFYIEEDEDTSDAFLEIEAFYEDMADTYIINNGFSFYGGDSEKHRYIFGVRFMNQKSDVDDQTASFVVIGKDIDRYQLKAYKNGERTEELTGAGATVTRYESTLGEYLEAKVDPGADSIVPKDYYIGLLVETLKNDGILSDSMIERYLGGVSMDMILSDVSNMVRIMYLSYKVIIPAGSEITLTAEMLKKASMYIPGMNNNANGYDIVTKLASKLDFIKQTASVTDMGSYDIVEQDFGFDVHDGTGTVELDIDREHYLLDIVRK